MRSRRNMLAAALAMPIMARAEGQPVGDWPNRTVTVVNPFSAGGFTDGLGRALLVQLQRSFGQTFVMDYRPGAGATVGASHVARSPADGYTLLYSPTTAWCVAPHLNPNAGYDPLKDLTPLALLAETPMVLCVRQGLPWRSVAALVAAAKAEPGKFSYASSGPGSLPHLMGSFFAAETKLELTHIPYKGGAPAMNDLIAGHVDIMWEAIPNVTQNVEAGRVHALAISGERRASALPGVPTVAEAGIPTLNLTSWIGLGGPAGMPAPIVAALNNAANAALASPEIAALMARLAMNKVGGPPAVMRARMERDGGTYARIIRERAITSE